MNGPYERFLNHLLEITQHNKNLKVNIKNFYTRISYANGGAVVNFLPSSNNRGVELAYGRTSAAHRGQGLGTRLRNYGVRAALAAGVPLWQYGINLNQLVPKGQTPISTRIMRKLGGVWTRGVPEFPKGRIVKKKYATLVRGHRYSLRKSVKKSPRRNNKNELRSPR
jgi:hypothetical protein